MLILKRCRAVPPRLSFIPSETSQLCSPSSTRGTFVHSGTCHYYGPKINICSVNFAACGTPYQKLLVRVFSWHQSWKPTYSRWWAQFASSTIVPDSRRRALSNIFRQRIVFACFRSELFNSIFCIYFVFQTMDPWKMTLGVQILVAICQEINSLNEVS